MTHIAATPRRPTPRRPSLRAAAAVVVLAAALVLPVAWFVTRQDVTCGIVVAIDQSSLTDVAGFTLRSPDGTTAVYRIEVGRLAPDSFVPGHLREHLALAAPVCVTHAPGDALALDLRDGPP